MGKPCVAIVDSNTFACIGLKDMLQNVMPIMDVDTFRSLQSWRQTDRNIIFIISLM